MLNVHPQITAPPYSLLNLRVYSQVVLADCQAAGGYRVLILALR